MNFLNELNIKTINKGVSSGHKWMGSKGPLIESFSPVDGKLIGSVKSADNDSYELVMERAVQSFKTWRSCRHQSAAMWSGR